MLSGNDIYLTVCAADIIPATLHITDFFHGNIADTGNSESVVMCCIGLVLQVEKTREDGIELDLVLCVGGNDLFGGSSISGVRLCTRLNPTSCIFVN